jgi:hypothetical protein
LTFELLFLRIDTVITFLVVPHAVPKAFFDGTNTYGTFFYSHKIGKCNTISNGLASAAIIINSVIPLFKVFVASFAPFFICLSDAHWAIKSFKLDESYYVAIG